MISTRSEFNTRQTMEEKHFECYHYLDPIPPLVDFHEHEFYEVYFFLGGDVSYIIDGRTYQLRPGDILLTDNRDIHRPNIRPGKPYERYVLWVHPDFIAQQLELGDNLSACFVDADQKGHKLIRPDSATLSHLKGICEKILRAQSEQAFGSRTLSYAYMTQFLVYLNRAYFATPANLDQDVTENEKVNQVVAYINENLQEDLTLDQIAGALYVSKYYLNHLFKAYTGLSLYQFIIKKRLVRARDMLREGYPVMDACLQCGFNDYSNFLKAFKREFGRSPKEFSSPR